MGTDSGDASVASVTCDGRSGEPRADPKNDVPLSLGPGRVDMVVAVPCHAATSAPLSVTITVAALAAGVLVALGLAAFSRRRSRSYLLVTLALAALLAQEVVGGLALVGTLDDGTHHLVEHALDVVLAGLVLAAVLFARRGDRRGEGT